MNGANVLQSSIYRRGRAFSKVTLAKDTSSKVKFSKRTPMGRHLAKIAGAFVFTKDTLSKDTSSKGTVSKRNPMGRLSAKEISQLKIFGLAIVCE